MGLILGLIAAFIVGAAMAEMGFTEPDFELPSRIFAIICGIIMMVPGMIIVPQALADYRKQKKKEEKGGIGRLWGFLKTEQVVPVEEEGSDRERGITAFRESFREFFRAESLEENAALQKDVTQLHWNILALQKRKLEKKNIRMEFDSERMRYGDYPDYVEKSYSDGKYRITEVAETLEARKVFYKEGRKIGGDRCTRLASFVLIDPRADGRGLVSCPSCGAMATRENLLDGCDYCGAKCTVEDMGENVSSFSFGQDYDLAYAQYQDVRSRFSLWVGLIVGIPISVLSLVMAVVAVFDGAAAGSGPIMTVASMLITVAFVTFAAVYLSLVFFYFFIFPGIQIIATVLHITGKNLEALKKARDTDPYMETKIRKDDPLFSRMGFYDNLQNMLATIFMGLSDDEILAFSEGEEAEREILTHKEMFRDVINASVNWMRITSYGIEEGMSRMIVEGYITLTKELDGKLKREKRHIRLQVSRDADCRTKAVTGPSFYRCKGCGCSMNILSGKKCESCGGVRDITSMDWAITHFKMYNK